MIETIFGGAAIIFYDILCRQLPLPRTTRLLLQILVALRPVATRDLPSNRSPLHYLKIIRQKDIQIH